MAITLDGTNGVTTPDLTVDTDTITVDSSNNRVGIGTASPTVPLQVAGDIKESVSGANAQISAITDGASNYATFTTTNGSRSYSMQVRPDQSNAFTIRDETGGANRFLINTSGHVTMPNQPAFMAYKNGNQSLTAHTLTKITGWTEAVDQSNEWDNTNGTFTATSGGVYLFGILMQSNVNGGLHLQVRKNGNNGIYGDNYLDGGDISGGSYTILMPMVANDYVEYLAYLTVNGNINSGRSKVWAVKVA